MKNYVNTQYKMKNMKIDGAFLEMLIPNGARISDYEISEKFLICVFEKIPEADKSILRSHDGVELFIFNNVFHVRKSDFNIQSFTISCEIWNSSDNFIYFSSKQAAEKWIENEMEIDGLSYELSALRNDRDNALHSISKSAIQEAIDNLQVELDQLKQENKPKNTQNENV